MWYKMNTPIYVRLYIILHLLNNQKLNFKVKNKKALDKNIQSIKSIVSKYYIKSINKGTIKFVTVKKLKSIQEYTNKQLHTMLEDLTINTLNQYNTHLKKTKRFKVDDSAVRTLTSTGNQQNGIYVQGFLNEIKDVLK